jgi:hypothetical protein
MLVVIMLKNSRLMHRFAHIGVYLVHAVSCKWRTRETYFPTTPYSYFSQNLRSSILIFTFTNWMFLFL